MSEQQTPSPEAIRQQLEMAQSQLTLYARDLKKTLERLRDSEERFRSIADGASDTILMLDHKGRIEYANPAAERLFGFSIEELLGQELFPLLVPGEQREAFQTDLEGFSRNGGRGELRQLLEMTALHRDGHGVPIELTLSPLQLKEERHVVGIMRDISERRMATEKQRAMLIDTIRVIAHAVEQRDPFTAGHMQRVAELATLIAHELGLGDEQVLGLRLGALIHDIGKIYVPSEILSRTGKLNDAEYGLIRTHPAVGFNIVNNVEFPWPVAQMIHQHHEHVDGSGYPNGLQGDSILLEARILTVADVVEAINSHRPYRVALGMAAAVEEITRHSGTYYDADVVAATLRLIERGEVEKILAANYRLS